MADVIHDPRTDWCACEPNADDRCEYRMLADKVTEALNPRDGDDAEVSLLMDAVERAAGFIASLPCCCDDMSDPYDPCPRCRAIGRLADKAVDW